MRVKIFILLVFMSQKLFSTDLPETSPPVVVLSVNCCVEGFNKDNYKERSKSFFDFLLPHVEGHPFVLGLQEIKPFEDSDFDLSATLYHGFRAVDHGCSHFICADVFPKRHEPQMTGTAVITNLRPTEKAGQYFLPNGKFVSLLSIHLTDEPCQLMQLTGEDYGDDSPFIIGEKDGKSVAQQVVESCKPRVDGLNALLEACEPLGNTILMGDFNEPSHEDWISGALEAELYGHPHIPEVIEWPCTKLLVETYGFRDAFRSFYPDVTTHRGCTYHCSPEIPVFGPKSRIDYIFTRMGSTECFEVLKNPLSDHHFIKAVINF